MTLAALSAALVTGLGGVLSAGAQGQASDNSMLALMQSIFVVVPDSATYSTLRASLVSPTAQGQLDVLYGSTRPEPAQPTVVAQLLTSVSVPILDRGQASTLSGGLVGSLQSMTGGARALFMSAAFSLALYLSANPTG